jgi:hypothetical protein
MKQLAALLRLLCAFVYIPQGASQDSRGFPIIENRAGWPIPAHSEPFATETRAYGKDQKLANVIRFRAAHEFPLPRPYQSGSGVLILNSFYFSVDEVDAIEYQGARFAFVASVRGILDSLASGVQWLDLNGNGSFTRIVWDSADQDISQWVLHHNRAATTQ